MSIEKITSENGLSQSKNLIQENIEQLKKLFPEIVTENKIDFKSLQQILGEEVEDEEEFYRFTWAGKSQAIREAHKPSTGTLRPCKEESLDWDTTQNLYIEGDNLEVLKILQKSYSGKIKMIYIDPPYNTGKDFVYKDNYKDNLKNYQEITGQVDSDGNKLSTNSDSDGRFHSNWLNMMYPRLRLARNLLKEEGVILISIDENEVDNLIKITKEIFGEENFISELIWEKNFAPKNDSKYYSVNHEYVLCISKNKVFYNRNLLPLTNKQTDRYNNPDNDPRGPWASDNLTASRITQKDIYPITTPTGKQIYPSTGNSWRVSKEKFQELLQDNRIYFSNGGNGVPRLKRFLSEIQQGRVPLSILYYEEVGHTQEGRQELKKIFDGSPPFDYPKPTRLLEHLIKVNSDDSDIVMDFFAGSGTTAHAVLNLNLKDKSNRKFLMVQLPEGLSNTDTLSKEYSNISHITRARIVRVPKN